MFSMMSSTMLVSLSEVVEVTAIWYECLNHIRNYARLFFITSYSFNKTLQVKSYM
jgi:hypothetical protein